MEIRGSVTGTWWMGTGDGMWLVLEGLDGGPVRVPVEVLAASAEPLPADADSVALSGRTA